MFRDKYGRATYIWQEQTEESEFRVYRRRVTVLTGDTIDTTLEICRCDCIEHAEEIVEALTKASDQ